MTKPWHERVELAYQIANDPKSSPSQLTRVVGFSDESDRLIAKHPKTKPESLIRLSKSLDAVTRQNLLENPNTPRDVVNNLAANLKLNSKNELVGNFTKSLDLRKLSVGNESESDNFSSEDQQIPTATSFYISNITQIEVLYLPCDRVDFMDYGVIEHLSNLKELHICRSDLAKCAAETKWISCKNLPKLEIITVDADIYWLELEGLQSLSSINVINAPCLDHFSIKNAPSIKQITLKNCLKLRRIVDLPNELQKRFDIQNQITEIQKRSKFSGELDRQMTYSDIDFTLSKINLATKEATRLGLLPEDFCDHQENNESFNYFSFKLLGPTEVIYNSGTGEASVYEFLTHDCIDGKIGICTSNGASSQEDCIAEAQDWLVSFGLESHQLCMPNI